MKALDEIYKIYTLFHRSDLKFLAKQASAEGVGEDFEELPAVNMSDPEALAEHMRHLQVGAARKL